MTKTAKIKQAVTQWDGKTLYRWYVHTDQGRKVTWAENKKEAQAHAEKYGMAVTSVKPAPDLLDQMGETP